ncbi:GyrI-like domain-containing protein [Paenibacillus yanchengensis]|uniref:GyrI-like domain-containing protein n=1 Tax=Paenibacillus yanchengensis TaxID=2035833 RepID=A0ABW4YF54_9BACL
MKTEYFSNITIAFMRSFGEYGYRNKVLMNHFKAYLADRHLLNDNAVLLGIALDNPSITAKHLLRYDVGLIVEGKHPITGNLEHRQIDNGKYAIIEVNHTEQGVLDFWSNIDNLLKNLPVDNNRPIMEFYQAKLVQQHLCEFCIPLKD